MKQTFEERQIALFATMQSMIHQIDEISAETKYKFKFKQECEYFYKMLEKKVEELTAHMVNDESAKDSYIAIVSEIDKLASSIKIKSNANN